jgi:hypothetical protein
MVAPPDQSECPALLAEPGVDLTARLRHRRVIRPELFGNLLRTDPGTLREKNLKTERPLDRRIGNEISGLRRVLLTEEAREQTHWS